MTKLITNLDKKLQFGLCIVFFLLSIRFIFSYLYAVSSELALVGFLGVIIIVVLSWWRLLSVLYLFILFIPLVSGVQNIGIAKGIPLFSFSFACIYIAWFFKRFFYQKKTIICKNIIDRIVDLFAGVIIISLLMRLASFPFEFVAYRFQFASVLRQGDPFWCFEASYIILQGLFLYRILSLEVEAYSLRKMVGIIFNFHTIIVIAFSTAQLLAFLKSGRIDFVRLWWPFDDIHSYGSYVLFLFFYNAFQVLGREKIKIFYIAASSFLFIFILFSFSRATWFAFLLVIFLILFSVTPAKKRKWLALFLTFSFIVINLTGSALLKTDNRYLNRFGKLVSVTNYNNDPTIAGRLLRWKIALRIIKDHPVIGSGIGTYFNIAQNYLSKDEKRQINKIHGNWSPDENVHNYYLQLCSEIGVIGILIFLSILLLVYKIRSKKVSCERKSDLYTRGMLLGLGAYLITMATSHPLIISKQQFLFWFIISAIVLTTVTTERKEIFLESKIGTIVLSLPFILFVILLPGYVLNARTIEDIEGLTYEYGLYEKEKIEKRRIRWTMKMSGSKQFAKTDIIDIQFYVMPDKVPEENLYLDIYLNNTQIDKINFKKSGFKTLVYHVPGIKNKEYLLRTKTNKTFNPYKLGLTRNLKHSRDQGVALGRVKYLKKLPKKNYKKINYLEISEQ